MQQSNFDDYPVIRIDESPAITNVHRTAGSGHPAERRRRAWRAPPFAPALINAIFAATEAHPRYASIRKQLET